MSTELSYSLFATVFGTDYSFMESSSVTFEPEDFNNMSSQMCLDVSLLSDSALEGDHSFQLLILSNLSEPEITPGSDNVVTISISDSNGAFNS